MSSKVKKVLIAVVLILVGVAAAARIRALPGGDKIPSI